jgi:HEAT repeat protein
MAVEAAIGEKLSDPIEHTRRRAQRLLEQVGDETASMLLMANTRDDVVEVVQRSDFDEPAFREWLHLFAMEAGATMSSEDVAATSSDDPLVGWAAANAARRAALSYEQADNLRQQYHAASDSETIRWRVVHALSHHDDDDENVAFLLRSFATDSAHWVKYGAVRAIIEVASQMQNRERRAAALTELADELRAYDPSERWMRKAILSEAVEAARVTAPPDGWVDDMAPVLDTVVEQADPESRDAISENVARLRSGPASPS